MGLIRNFFHTRLYSVINDDHVNNFRILTDLRKLVASPGSMVGDEAEQRARVDEAINDLMDALVVHLCREECLMKATGYRAFAQHRAEHLCLLRTIQIFQANALKRTQPLTTKVVRHLRDWIIAHINASDHMLELYMNTYREPIDVNALSDDEWMALSPHNIELTPKSVALWATLTFFKLPRVVESSRSESSASDDDMIAHRLQRMGTLASPPIVRKQRRAAPVRTGNVYY